MPAQDLIWLFIPLLFAAAFLYASVGHGGASAYLALMVIFGFSPAIIRPNALLLNIFVSLIAFHQFYKGGYFKWHLFWPFVITSVPASFFGAFITLDNLSYKKVLGVLLIFPVLRLMGVFGKERHRTRELLLLPALAAGAVIGLLSGMTGIGGGILLSPLILLMHWGNMKQTAAVSALFIFVNSVAGLAGQYSNGLSVDSHAWIWLLAAVAGGLAGGYFGRTRFNTKALKAILASVLVVACVKLLMIESVAGF